MGHRPRSLDYLPGRRAVVLLYLRDRLNLWDRYSALSHPCPSEWTMVSGCPLLDPTGISDSATCVAVACYSGRQQDHFPPGAVFVGSVRGNLNDAAAGWWRAMVVPQPLPRPTRRSPLS